METTTRGEVGNVVNLGTRSGVLVVHDDVSAEVEGRVLGMSGTGSFHGSSVTETTDRIRVFIKSKRWARTVQLPISRDIPVRAFINVLVHVLGLPRSKSFPELMVSFDFTYSVVFRGQTISMDIPLREAGISEDDEVHLSISPGWRDELQDFRGETKSPGDNFLAETGTRIQHLRAREATRIARGALTPERIEKLANSCCAHVDKLGV